MPPKKIDYSKLTTLEKLYFGPLWLAEGLMNGVVSTLASTDDVSIRQRRDGLKTGLEGHREGNPVFDVCDDPKTGMEGPRTTHQHHRFFSEDDLRTWLDQRYYRDTRPPNLDWMYHRQRWLR
jgi:hypothetical protein